LRVIHRCLRDVKRAFYSCYPFFCILKTNHLKTYHDPIEKYLKLQVNNFQGKREPDLRPGSLFYRLEAETTFKVETPEAKCRVVCAKIKFANQTNIWFPISVFPVITNVSKDCVTGILWLFGYAKA